MYKNLLKSIAFAALALVAGACAKEQVASGDGDTVEATFNVDVPETTITTKGLSDAAQVNELKFQLFIKDGDGYKMVQEQIVPVAEKKAVVKATLVKRQSYAAAFWAQTSGTGFYETTDLRAVKMNIANVKANEPTMDAFWGNENSIIAASGMKPRSVKLHRALAQVNFGTVIPTGADALSITKSQVVMKGVPTTLNVLLGNDDKAHSGSENITFQDNAPISGEKLIIADGGTQYDYVATAYVFAPKSGNLLTDVSAKVTFNNGKSTTISAPNVPIHRNYRTNILGNLLSVDGEWNITITEGFDKNVTYDAVSANLTKGATVTLSEDYKVTIDNWTGINIPVGTESVLNLNGHRFANEDNGKTADAKSALVVKGKLTINGDGEVFCEGNTTRKSNVTTQPSNTCISVLEGGHLIINGGNYSVGTDVDNKCNSTIYVENVGKAGKVEIYGGTFTNAKGENGHSFVLNQDGQLTEKCITVYGGTFIGFNPADNTSDGEHTNYVAEGYKSVKISDSPETWKVVDASVSVADQAEFEKTLSNLSGTDDVVIKLGTGNFEFKKSGYAGNITLKGAGIGKTVVTANTFYENVGVTISLENLTFDSKNPYVGDAQLCQFLRSDIVFTNCEINGVVGVMAQKSATFTGCTFKNSTNSGFTGYSIIYYGYDNSTITVDDCKFETTGKAICLYGTAGIYNLVVKDCEFLTSNKDKAAIQIHTDYTNGDAASTLMRGNVNITNTTVSGFNGIWWEGLNDKTPKVPTKYFTITIDGTTVQTGINS